MVERGPGGDDPSSGEYMDARLTSDEDEGDEGEEPPIRTGPPVGPPPPVAVPIQALQSTSHRLSTVLASTLGVTRGQIVTILDPHWAALQRITLVVRGMAPGETMHPHLLHLADDGLPNQTMLEVPAGPTLAEGPAVPPPAPPTPRAPARRRRVPMTQLAIDTIEADLDLARLQVNLDIEEGLNTDMADDEAELEDGDTAIRMEDDDEEYVTALLDEPHKPKKSSDVPKGNKKSRSMAILMIVYGMKARTPRASQVFMMEHNEANLRKRTLIRAIDRSQQELVAWLKAEEARGDPVDIFCVQETAWKEDFEFCTAQHHPLEPQWHAVHAGGPARTGILCFIRSSLLPAAQIRYAVLMPGRAMHVRLLFEIPLDLLLLYQVSWNPHKAELTGHKLDSLVQQRAKLWRQVEQWLARIPLRNGTMIIGDLNTPLYPEKDTRPEIRPAGQIFRLGN
ncbi:unnamed protein product [Symbiodinium microadriaticum]|nr:unnamed protein product [Symbiodinium microadriaticum]